MTTLKFSPRFRFNSAYVEADVARIQSVCRAAGYEIGVQDAAFAWDAFSESMCAGWLMVDCYSDEEIVGAVLLECVEVDL